MSQNARRGGRPSRFEPATSNTFPGQGILGEPPRQLQQNFGQNNTNRMGNMGPPQAKFGGPVNIPGGPGGLPNPGMAGILGLGGPNNVSLQQIQELLRQAQNSAPNPSMGNVLQQQQQRSFQSSNTNPTSLMQLQMLMQQQQPQMSGQNTSIRDTQLNIVNNLLKGAMQGNGRMNNGPINNNGRGQGLGTGNSIMGTPFLGNGGPNQFTGMNGNFRGSGQGLASSMGLSRPQAPSGGVGQNRQIPSIFDIITSPTNGIMQQQQQQQQRKRPGFRGQSQFEPDVKRFRQEGSPYPPGGSLTQTPRSRPDIRNSLLGNPRSDRSLSIGQSGRRDSSGSSHSDRSQGSRWQPFKGHSGGNKEEYDPAEPTGDQSRPNSVDSSSVAEVDGDFRVTVDNTGRSISDKKEENEARAAAEEAKKSPHFCHTCNLECKNEQNFTEHMQSDFHKECLQGLLSLTQQKSSQLQARLKAEAHLRSIEGETSGNKPVYCKTCDESVVGSLIQHRRSTQHKMKERMNWPECSVCNQTFKSPQKLVRHMSTSHHKDKRRESLQYKDEGAGSDQSAENSDVEEATSEPDESTCGGDKQNNTSTRHTAALKDQDQYPVGVQFVVPATGFFCQLCRKFYSSETSAKVNHCQSTQHRHNYQEWLASQSGDKDSNGRASESEKNSAEPQPGENGTDSD